MVQLAKSITMVQEDLRTLSVEAIVVPFPLSNGCSFRAKEYPSGSLAIGETMLIPAGYGNPHVLYCGLPHFYRDNEAERYLAQAYQSIFTCFERAGLTSLALPALGCNDHCFPHSISARLAAKACNEFLSRIGYPVHIYFALPANTGPTFATAFMMYFNPPHRPEETKVMTQGLGLELAGNGHRGQENEQPQQPTICRG